VEKKEELKKWAMREIDMAGISDGKLAHTVMRVTEQYIDEFFVIPGTIAPDNAQELIKAYICGAVAMMKY